MALGTGPRVLNLLRRSISEPPWNLSLLLGLPGVCCYLTVLGYLHSLTLRGPLSGRVTARAAKPAAEWFLRAKRGTLRVGDCVYTTPGPSGGTAGVPEVRADSVQGLAGRGRGYPSGILGFGYVRGYDSGFGPLHLSPFPSRKYVASGVLLRVR